MNVQDMQDKSIPQLVIEKTLTTLDGKDEFPEVVINQLERIASKGELNSHTAIIRAISIDTGELPCV